MWLYHIRIKVMRAKSLRSSQILRAHMPYFRRPGHIYHVYSSATNCDFTDDLINKDWSNLNVMQNFTWSFFS